MTMIMTAHLKWKEGIGNFICIIYYNVELGVCFIYTLYIRRAAYKQKKTQGRFVICIERASKRVCGGGDPPGVVEDRFSDFLR